MAVVETRVALKVLSILYVLATVFGFLASVPMVLHVYPQSECLLFSSQISEKLFYGHHAICNIIAYIFLFVVAGAVYLLFKTWQERKARAGHPTEKTEHQKIPKNIVTIHVVGFLMAALLTIITTAGYVSSCNNLHGDVSTNVKMKLNADPYDSRGKEIRDRVEDDYKFHSYNQKGNQIGSDFYNLRITCRSILTDPEIHQKLHDSHYDLQSRYYGYWYGTDLYAYDSQAEATKANGLVEASMAGGWLCLACWVGGLILIFLQKYVVKQQKLDLNRRASEATMFGTNFNDSQPIATSGIEEPLKPGRKRFSNRGSNRSRDDFDPVLNTSEQPLTLQVQQPMMSYVPQDMSNMVLNTSQQPLTMQMQQPMMSYAPQNMTNMVLNQNYPQPNWVTGYVVGPGNFAINPNFNVVGPPQAGGYPQYNPNTYHHHKEEFETEIF